MSRVSLINISKKFKNGVKAVEDFSLDIEEGEFIILVGPSGCGKSTTLRMIAGLDEISGGELWIDDRLVNFMKSQERKLSMVFQNYALYPHMNVYQNIAFGLKCSGVEKNEIDKRVNSAAKILEISNLLSRRPGSLSGGQKQRVAIGSVIARQSDLILMDEPLSNLDAKLRSQMRVELAKLHNELKSTIIYVTHDQVEAMTLGTKIVVMNQGRIQQAARPAQIYENPVNKFIAGFIGSPAMNFIEVIAVPRNERIYLEFGNQSVLLNERIAEILTEKGYLGQKLTLGIRPEDLHTEGEECTDISLDVDVREMLGAEILLHGEADGSEICVKLPAENEAGPGDRIRLYADMSRIKLFDTETEENILYIKGAAS